MCAPQVTNTINAEITAQNRSLDSLVGPGIIIFTLVQVVTGTSGGLNALCRCAMQGNSMSGVQLGLGAAAARFKRVRCLLHVPKFGLA